MCLPAKSRPAASRRTRRLMTRRSDISFRMGYSAGAPAGVKTGNISTMKRPFAATVWCEGNPPATGSHYRGRGWGGLGHPGNGVFSSVAHHPRAQVTRCRRRGLLLFAALVAVFPRAIQSDSDGFVATWDYDAVTVPCLGSLP